MERLRDCHIPFTQKNAEAPEHIIREENGISSLFLPSAMLPFRSQKTRLSFLSQREVQIPMAVNPSHSKNCCNTGQPFFTWFLTVKRSWEI